MKRQPFCFAHLYGNVGLGMTYFGKKIMLNTRNTKTYSIITHGKLEPAICYLFKQLIKPNDVVVDVGANIGFLTLLAGKLVGPQGHVYAYEPNPDVFKLLSENMSINAFRSRTTVKQLAVYHSNAELTLTWNSRKDGSGRIVTEQMSSLANRSEQVQGEALDILLADKKVDLIKIDTEGSEPHVLFGAHKVIKNNPNLKIIMEWNPKHIEQRGGDLKKTIEFIFDHFKQVEEIKKVKVLSPLRADDLPGIAHSNLLLSN